MDSFEEEHLGPVNMSDDLNMPQTTPNFSDLIQTVANDYNGCKDNIQQQSPAIKEEDSDSEYLWTKMQEHMIEIADSSPDSDNESVGPDIKEEPKEYPVTFNHDGDRVVEILDSDDEGWVHPIKEEPSDLSMGWSNLPSEPIILSDTEDNANVHTGSTMPLIKQEPGVEVLWAHNKDSGVIDILDSDEENTNLGQRQPTAGLGLSLLRRSNPGERRRHLLDPRKMREIQQKYAVRALEGGQRLSSAVSGAGKIFSIPGPSEGGNPHSVSHRDKNAWMRLAPQETIIAAGNFEEIKRQYKAKKKARTATIQDDIAFQKAQDAEKAHLRMLEAKMYRMDSSEDEAQQSDDDLFLPGITLKRGLPIDTAEDGDDEGASSHTLRSKKQKSGDKPAGIRDEVKSELYHNIMAGYEEEAAKDQKKQEHIAIAAHKAALRNADKRKKNSKNKKDPNSIHTHELKQGKRPGGKPKPNSKLKMKIRNFKTADIYKESNANLVKQIMPTMTAKEKKKAMTNLIASIPLKEETKMKQVITDKCDILKATTILGKCKVNENRKEGVGDWNLGGLKTPIFHHQVQAAGRMKQAECRGKLPLGGILADEMGHGKTLSAIAAMVSNRPAPSDRRQCTLIVANTAIISQWDEELNKHTEPGVLGHIIRHYSSTQVSTKGASGREAISYLENAGVVLSTYPVVSKSYPKCNIPEGFTKPVEKMGWWKKEWEQERGLLHRVQFHRVILDESQCIKNRRSLTSIACRALMAKHRWAVSGTPIQNSTEEIYPYFKFLRVPYAGSFRLFKHNFCDPENPACPKRLHSYLEGMMIRRTHQDELLGTAIVKLPKAHQQTNYLHFNEVEGRIYLKIRKRFLKVVNVVLADMDRTDEDRRNIILTMVLRLRQITSHLFMLQEVLEGMFDVEDIDDVESDLSEDSLTNGDCLDMLKALRIMIEAKDDDYEKEKIADRTKQGKNEPDQIFEFRKQLRTLKNDHKWGELRNRSICLRCKLPPEEPMLTSCSHLYCAECLRAMSYEASEKDQDRSKCLECNEVFARSMPCIGLKELEPINITPPEKVQTKQRQGLLAEKIPDRPQRSVNDTMKWVVLDDRVVLSTKTAAVIRQIETWLETSPSQKIIVFSQFHLVFQIVGKACEKKKWKFCFYHGKMSDKSREEAIAKLSKDDDVKIMIASLKCGGTGLNLTMASRVICIDLWFNSSVEQQAFCRVLRIGQTLETHIARFVIKNTIDERLIQLQKHKDRNISALMDDRTVLAKLSMKDLLSLFGEMGHDANSQPFVYAEDNGEKLWGPLREKETVVEAVEDEVAVEEEAIEEAT